MKSNVGKTDKIIRVVIGVGIIAAGFIFKSWLGVIGIIPLFTALIGWCPLYLPCGLSSCKNKNIDK